jgi:hypothetical protein
MTIVAPQHEIDLERLEPYVIEGVEYSPLKIIFYCGYDDGVRVYCKSCEWETVLGDLPQDSGYVVPDLCPDCAKNDELGFVAHDPPKNAKPEDE